MIQPSALVDHARRLVGNDPGRPREVDLRRGISAAYYALFHELTDRAARHLLGSASDEDRSRLRRSWTHGELAAAAEMVVERARTIASNPTAGGTKEVSAYGPLVDLAAGDADLVEALRRFGELQQRRHEADYDHNAAFDKVGLISACRDAELGRTRLDSATPQSREAFFTLITVRRSDFRAR